MKFEPAQYQRYCIQRLITDNRVALWLDRGLGKTAITLTAIGDLRYNRFAVQKVLVIAPKKVAEATWQQEARRWDHLGLLRFSSVMGSEQKRIRALATPADIYVISRDNLVWLVGYYRNDWPYDMVVLDESTTYKNPKAKRFKAMRLVAPRTKRIVELTGTPAPKGLMDIWAQIYLLDAGERLGKTITGYRERFFTPDKRNRATIFSYRPKEDAEDAIHKQLADICVGMKSEDWLTLPALVPHTIPVVLDASARRAYRKLERELLLEVDESTITAQTAAVLRGKLLQLCSGAVYDVNGVATVVHGCKIEAFLEAVEGLTGQSALVFYSYKHDKERLLSALAGTGLVVRTYAGPEDGEAWNAGKIDILLAHPASCAYGLNLQEGGHHIIWFGLTDNLELYQQACKRLHRRGQTHPVIVHHLVVQDGVDEDVLANIDGKAGTQEALLQALKARIKRVKQSDGFSDTERMKQ
jgi:SNF2 family DNA or RNA helicase